MNATEYITLALSLLQTVLANAKVQGLAGEIVADVAAAVAKLEGVRGTPVIYSQLESLRMKSTF